MIGVIILAAPFVGLIVGVVMIFVASNPTPGSAREERRRVVTKSFGIGLLAFSLGTLIVRFL